MTDIIRNDYRGNDNRHQTCKHKKLVEKQKRYWIKQAKVSCNRFPATSYTKKLFNIYDELVNDIHETVANFCSIDDALAFELCHYVYRNDIDQVETFLYLLPGVFERLINTFPRSTGCLYPTSTPLMVAASCGNDKLVQMFLNESTTIDVNLKIDNNIELNKNKFSDNLRQCRKTINCICNYCKSEIGRPALWIACYHGHLNVVRLLIEIGKADVNLSDHNNYTPLQAAIFNKHFDIVKYLIEQANATINESQDLCIAIQSESYDIIEFLLEKGCDPNTRLINQNLIYTQSDYTFFALHYAIDNDLADLSIIKTILKHGGDPTIKDKYDRTALHIAVQNGNKEIIKEILNFGYKHDQRDINGFTPLMLALCSEQTDIINIFYEMLPRQQYIDELMLLGSYYVLEYQPDFFTIHLNAFEYFEQALKLQEPNSDSLRCEIYLFQKECQTVDELINIQNNNLSMYIQGLLVYERLLPQRDEIYLLIPKLIDFSDTYSDIEQFDQSFLILTHVYPMILSCKENLFNHWDRTCHSKFTYLLGKLIVEERINHMEKIIQVFEWIFNQSEDIQQLSELCIYITYLIIIRQINNDDKLRLIRLIRQIVNTELTGCTVFHQIVWICTLNYGQLFEGISSENVVRLLIKCGADVNSPILNDGRRPIHLIGYASCKESALAIGEILITAGAHTDCLDSKGFLPEAHANNVEVREYLRSKRSMSLKCQCTHLIISKGIKYDSYLTQNLKDFIHMHQQ